MESGVSEVTTQTPKEALGQTDRSLRRILRQLKDSDFAPSEGFEMEIRRAQRQLRINKELLDDERSEESGEQG